MTPAPVFGIYVTKTPPLGSRVIQTVSKVPDMRVRNRRLIGVSGQGFSNPSAIRPIPLFAG